MISPAKSIDITFIAAKNSVFNPLVRNNVECLKITTKTWNATSDSVLVERARCIYLCIYGCPIGICTGGGTGCGVGTSGRKPMRCKAHLAAFAFASFLFKLVVFGWNIWPLIWTFLTGRNPENYHQNLFKFNEVKYSNAQTYAIKKLSLMRWSLLHY